MIPTKCEKCNSPIYPAYYRNSDKKFKTIFHTGVGKQVKRVYWCKNCKKFYHKFIKWG